MDFLLTSVSCIDSLSPVVWLWFSIPFKDAGNNDRVLSTTAISNHKEKGNSGIPYFGSNKRVIKNLT